MSTKLNEAQKAALLIAIKESLAKSNAGMQMLSGVEVGDTISIVDFKTESTNPRANVSPENPSYIFESDNRKKYQVSGNGIPTMRVVAEGKDATIFGADMTLATARNNPDMEFFKQTLEALEDGPALDITKVKFTCIAKLVQADTNDAAKPALIPSCYRKFDDYLAETRAADIDWNAARARLHASGLKPEFVNKSWAIAADHKYFSTTPVFSVAWNQ